MFSKDELKRLVCEEIDNNANELINIAKVVLENPEPGYREEKTSRLVVEQFKALGISNKSGLALTGVKGVIKGANEGPTVGVIGELDSLIVIGHPKADPTTNAAHACGHHAQIGMLIGVATGLIKSKVLDHLSGNIALMAVPAEEYIEVEFREELRRQGKVEFLGGKSELIKLGAFDDVDMAMMTHTTSDMREGKLAIGGTNNGIVAKSIQFIGKAAHAGGAPHKGINALNAAMLALSAIHVQRETHRDEDSIRVHPIITQGGTAVNSVPSDVRMETFVRGKTIAAVDEAAEKVDLALRAGALAVGAKVKITTLPGYLPISNNENMMELWKSNAVNLVGDTNVGDVGHRGGSTDMGDLSQIMPVIHPYVGGAVGNGHGSDYLIKDYTLAVLTSAKAMAMTVIDLLADNGNGAKFIKAEQKVAMTKQQYLSYMRKIYMEEVYQS
jgi:amidohydrolase